MKETFIDHGDWTETQYEPDDPPAGAGKTNGGAAPPFVLPLPIGGSSGSYCVSVQSP